MKRELLIGSLTGFFLVVLVAQAQALTFDGNDTAASDPAGANGLLFTGPDNSNPSLEYLEGLLGVDPLYELYKDEITGEEKSFADSYDTSYSGSNDLSSFDISWVGDPQPWITGQSYLLVKDGNHDPYWYLYDLTSLGWDGKEILSGINFWGGDADEGGSISHVSIYGTTEPVPEPATMLLFGTGLIGLAGLRARKRNQ